MQPKPQKGLRGSSIENDVIYWLGFNAAEATEGFKSIRVSCFADVCPSVSMQPKPQKGLRGKKLKLPKWHTEGFNAAEATEGFKSY